MTDLITTIGESFGLSLGWSIVLFSLAVRFTLLPLSIKLARHTSRIMEKQKSLAPEIEQLKKRYKKDPQRYIAAVAELYRKHNCSSFDMTVMAWMGVQLPVFGLMYQSIQNAIASSGAFLWMRSLSVPDVLLTLGVAALTAISAYLMPAASEHGRTFAVCLQTAVAVFVVWKLAAGLGLYWASSSIVGMLQTLWLRYRPTSPTV